MTIHIAHYMIETGIEVFIRDEYMKVVLDSWFTISYFLLIDDN